MSFIVSLLVRLLSLVGISLSPFAAGAILAAIVVGAIGILEARVYLAGKRACENSHLLAQINEERRERAAIEKIQQRDARRAAEAEERLRRNEEMINATPSNSRACLDRDGARRVREIR